jgi:DeoR/GlpR family transcriptional regulator of sugar metabolism
MHAAERRQAILERLARDGRVVASDLVDQLAVSEDTVRRDLRELAAQGLVQRVHGGALPAAPAAAAVSFAERLERDGARKSALARAAVPLLDGASVILLDGGTSTLELARRLPHDHACTVLTNAPPVASALAGHPRADVVMLGGRMLKRAQVTVGPEAMDALRRVRADVAVLGVCSVHPELGVTAREQEEAEVDRAMVAAAADVVVLATADKLGTASPWLVAELGELTHIVTDAGAEAAVGYAGAGLTVVQA